MIQFMTKPQRRHLATIKRIIHYLMSTSDQGLFFHVGSSLQLTAYSDADWAGCPDSRKATTSWCMHSCQKSHNSRIKSYNSNHIGRKLIRIDLLNRI